MLHRTIFYELTRVFLLALIGITGIIVMAALVVEASQRGLGPAQVLAAIPLLVPSMLPFIIPPTTLFASCVVFGRLAHDSEITAIKAAGVSVLYVVWPGIFLGTAMSAATMGLYYYLIPYTHHVLRTGIVNDMEDYLYAMLKKDHEIKGRNESKMSNESYEVYVLQVQGRQLKNAIFKKKDASGYTVVARSSEAELHVDQKANQLLVHMRNGYVMDASGGNSKLFFNDQYWEVPLPTMPVYKPSARDMTWQELLQARQEVFVKMDEIAATLALVVAQQATTNPPSTLDRTVRDLNYALREQQLRLNGFNTELQMRPALSGGCLFFVLIGCPVGIWLGRSDYLSAFITCFLPIVFVYYPLQLCSTNLAKDGKLHPFLALWMANAVIGLGAVLLFRRLLKH